MLYVYFACHLIISTCTTAKHVHMHQRYNRIEVKNTIHSYVERLAIHPVCIIATSGSCDSDSSVLTGTSDTHFTVLF